MERGVRPFLSIVVPLYNESSRVQLLEDGLDEFLKVRDFPCEVILVDDGSTDDTVEKLERVSRKFSAKYADDDFRICKLEFNSGKGRALQRGVAESSGKWLLTLDADMSVGPAELLKWHESCDALRGPDAICIGDRSHPHSDLKDVKSREFIGRIFNFIVQMMTGLDLRDTQCGFKLYPGNIGRELFAAMKMTGWAHDVELLLRAKGRGVAVKSLPVSWHYVSASTIAPLRDAPRMFWDTLRASVKAWLGFRGDKGLKWKWATRAAILGVLFFYMSIARDFGISWDEPIQYRYGETVYNFYASGGEDNLAQHCGAMRLYGGFFDGLSTVFQQLFPAYHPFDIRRIVTGLAAVLGIIGAGCLARLLGGWPAAFFSVLLLAIEPNYLGHAFNNPKDIPFAALHIWCLYFMIRAVRCMPKLPSGLVFKLGLVMGMALGTRIGGAFLVGYLGLGMGLWLVVDMLRRRHWVDGRTLFSATATAFVTCVIAYAIMLVSWPWAQLNPLFHPLMALVRMSSYGWNSPLLLNGRTYLPSELPWTYVPHYFVVKLPFLIQVAAICGTLIVARRLLSKKMLVSGGMTLFALVFPLAYVLIKGATIYDGLRHFIFYIPIMAALGGMAVAFAGEAVARRIKSGWAAMLVIFLLASWPQVDVMIGLHPYEYIYYNRLVGGVQGAVGRYAIDYWGHSYGEAVNQLVKYVNSEVAAGREELPVSVSAYGPRDTLLFYLPNGFEWKEVVEEAEYVIAFTRFKADESLPGPTIGVVSRLGVKLSVIKAPHRNAE